MPLLQCREGRARRSERDSEKVGEGQREGGIETKGIKSGGVWFGMRVALVVTIVEIVMRGEVIE